jgi:phage shock protein A
MPTRWPAVEPALVAAVGNNEWVSLSDHLSELRSRLRVLREEAVPSAEEAARDLSDSLHENEGRLVSLTAAGAELRQSLALDRDQLSALSSRIDALEEDRRRYRDAITLRDLGSDAGPILEGEECPACHRPLPEALMVPAVPPPMSLEQNADFISEQIQTFRLMQDDTQRHLDVASQQLAALRTRIAEVRQEIRAARTTLTLPGRSPSVAAVRQELQLEDRVERLEALEQDFYGLLAEIRPIVDAAGAARTRLLTLPKERLDETDEAKLGALEGSVVSQLTEYGFRSFDVGTIGISRDNYLPTREGFDLGFVTSASDAIRIVWAYLLGMLEVSQNFETNHPRLLMFDEPRQQAADPLSFQALLRRAAHDAVNGAQVLFATSEPEVSLEAFLEGLNYAQTTFEGMALERLG